LASAGVDGGSSEEAWNPALTEGDGQHPDDGVKAEREVCGADVAEPEMFTPAKLPAIAVKSVAEVGRESFRQEQLAFAQRTKGYRARRVGAFMQRGLGPVFSSVEFLGQRALPSNARQGPNPSAAD